MPDSQNLKKNQEQQLSHSRHPDNLSAGNSSSWQLNSQTRSANTNQPASSEYYQLNNQSDDRQQFHADNTPKSQQYDSSSQRQILHNAQQSFNEQRKQYAEQAFNDYASQPQQMPQQIQPPPAQPPQDLPQPPQEFQRCHYGGGKQQERQDSAHTDQILHNGNSDTLTEKGSMLEDGTRLGTVEVPDGMKKLSDKIQRDRVKQDRIYGRLKETATKSSRTHFEKKRKELKEDDQEERLHETEKDTGRIKQENKKRLHDNKGDSNSQLKDAPHGNQDKRQNRKDKRKHLYDKKHNTGEDAEDLHAAVDDVLYGKGRLRHRHKKDEEDKFSRVKVNKVKTYYGGRLKFEKRTTYEKLTRTEYNKNVKDRDKCMFKKRVTWRLLQDKVKFILDDDSIEKDDLSRDYSMALKRGYRMADFYVRRKTKYLRDTYNPYARLQTLAQRERYHMDQQKRLQNRLDRKAQRDKIRDAATKEERKRMKKEMQKQRVEKEGSFIRRTANQFKMTKQSVAYKQQMAKKTVKTLGVVCSIAGVLMPILIIVVLIVMGFVQGSAVYFGTAVVQVGYGDITDATEYFRNLETDLDEYLSDREALEEELQLEYGPDIYEFNYDLPGFGFSANTLVAYLAAKYGEFKLNDDTKAELQEIFQEMYTLDIYTAMEEREIVDTSVTDSDGNHPTHVELKKICHIKLNKKELEKVVEPRLTEDQLKQYKAYKLSTGGQQVYGPVMKEDWSSRISSNFGDRIHPITGERKQHKGVDIAVPTGTRLYSAVTGTVTTARYSDSAGYMVTIQNDNGWTVTFMHMNNFAVTSGQKVQRGDFVGESGNTGNSTGPHLHLQVNDSTGNPINPIFIIPQTCGAD